MKISKYIDFLGRTSLVLKKLKKCHNTIPTKATVNTLQVSRNQQNGEHSLRENKKTEN